MCGNCATCPGWQDATGRTRRTAWPTGMKGRASQTPISVEETPMAPAARAFHLDLFADRTILQSKGWSSSTSMDATGLQSPRGSRNSSVSTCSRTPPVSGRSTRPSTIISIASLRVRRPGDGRRSTISLPGPVSRVARGGLCHRRDACHRWQQAQRIRPRLGAAGNIPRAAGGETSQRRAPSPGGTDRLRLPAITVSVACAISARRSSRHRRASRYSGRQVRGGCAPRHIRDYSTSASPPPSSRTRR